MNSPAAATTLLFPLWTFLAVLTARPAEPPTTVSMADALDPAFHLVREAVDRGDVPGAIALVARGGRILRHEAFGLRDLEKSLPFTTTTLCWIASITKPVTVAAAMTLVDAGKLGLDDPVENYLPEFRGQTDTNGVHQVFTIRQLMSHTSGLVPNPPTRRSGWPMGGPLDDSWLEQALSDIVQTIARSQLRFAPGSKFEYSNSALFVLGRVIEVVSGQAYAAFVKERILQPLGMSDTHYAPPSEEADHIAVIYARREGQRETIFRFKPAVKIANTAPDGGLFSYPAQLLPFLQLFLDNNGRVLSRRSVAEMLTPQPHGWGLGWSLPEGLFLHEGSSGTLAWADPVTGVIGMLFTQYRDQSKADDRLRQQFRAAVREAIPRTPAQSAQRLDPMIQKIVAEISEDRIRGILAKLESFETRHTMSDPAQTNRGIGVARQWIFDQFKSYSPRLEVSFDTHQIPKAGRIWKDVELRNVVALLPGKNPAAKERWILVCGHYDSLNLKVPPEMRGHPEQAAELPAPGVSDDASGTACAMECARVLSQYEFDATLVFAAFAGEEQGLVGARAMAKRLKSQKQEIEAVLNNDIIGNEVSGNGASDNRRVLLFSEDPNDSSSRQLARFARLIAGRCFPEMTVDLVFRHDRFGRGGDHTAFNQEGYPAVRFTTASENFANQHSPTDTLANASPGYAASVTRINAACAAALALAPRPPVTKSASPATRTGPGLTRGAGYDAVLRWQQPDGENDLAGFAIVSRSTTEPDWTREIWAGNVREFTLKNTPIDQFVFGVKAIDRDGHESPVSAYVTVPRRPGDLAPEP